MLDRRFNIVTEQKGKRCLMRSGSLDFGIQLSRAGLGCDNFGDPLPEEESVDIVHAALNQGVSFFDVADCYGDGRAEEYLGKALRSAGRDEYIIATKFGSEIGGTDWRAPGGASPGYVRRAVDNSLRRLGVDYIDLYQLHGPDLSVPIEETLTVLGELIQAGKVRHIGASNFALPAVASADAAASVLEVPRFTSMQLMWNILNCEAGETLVPAFAKLGIWTIPWFPLAGGLLTGKYQRGIPFPPGSRFRRMADRIGFLATDGAFDRIEALEKLAESFGVSLLRLSLSWLAAQEPVLCVIAGAMTPGQLVENVRATLAGLTADQLAQIDALPRGSPSIGAPVSNERRV
jgi:aryl-alcohol dehydrogenase-like predicted oxidoreductase